MAAESLSIASSNYDEVSPVYTNSSSMYDIYDAIGLNQFPQISLPVPNYIAPSDNTTKFEWRNQIKTLQTSGLFSTNLLDFRYNDSYEVNLVNVRNAIENFNLSTYAHSEAVSKRLSDIFLACLEEHEEIQYESLKLFFSFLESNPELPIPMITLSDRGLLRSKWRKNAIQRIVLEFLDNQKCNYAVFDYDTFSKETKYDPGSCNLNALNTLVKKYSHIL